MSLSVRLDPETAPNCCEETSVCMDPLNIVQLKGMGMLFKKETKDKSFP